eukprot:7065592-Pyramimonas_sp.AAC.1
MRDVIQDQCGEITPPHIAHHMSETPWAKPSCDGTIRSSTQLTQRVWKEFSWVEPLGTCGIPSAPFKFKKKNRKWPADAHRDAGGVEVDGVLGKDAIAVAHP